MTVRARVRPQMTRYNVILGSGYVGERLNFMLEIDVILFEISLSPTRQPGLHTRELISN